MRLMPSGMDGVAEFDVASWTRVVVRLGSLNAKEF